MKEGETYIKGRRHPRNERKKGKGNAKKGGKEKEGANFIAHENGRCGKS